MLFLSFNPPIKKAIMTEDRIEIVVVVPPLALVNKVDQGACVE